MFLFATCSALAQSTRAIPVHPDQCWDESTMPKEIPMIFMMPRHRTPASCPRVDLRSGFPPVRNQGPLGWCYGYAAADLVSYATGQSVSAVDMVMNYQRANSENHRDNLNQRGINCKVPLASIEDGGTIKDAVNLTKARGGFCVDDDLATAENLAQEIRVIEDTVRRIREGSLPNMDDAKRAFAHLFPQANVSALVEEIHRARGPLHHVFRDMAVRACKNRRKPMRTLKAEEMKTETKAQKRAAMAKVDELLAKGRPVGYSSYFPFTAQEADAHRMKEAWAHETVIVGREWNATKGVCEYILRNSYGTDCAQYNWTRKGRVISESSHKCENGHIWIPENQIMSAMYGVTWLEGSATTARPRSRR